MKNSVQRAPVGIVDIMMKKCDVSRERTTAVGSAQKFTIQAGLSESPSDEIIVTLGVSVTPQAEPANGVEPDPVYEATAECILVLSEPQSELPDDLVHVAVSLAWPYLRSAIDAVTSVVRLPPVAMPSAPPMFSIEQPPANL